MRYCMEWGGLPGRGGIIGNGVECIGVVVFRG